MTKKCNCLLKNVISCARVWERHSLFMQFSNAHSGADEMMWARWKPLTNVVFWRCLDTTAFQRECVCYLREMIKMVHIKFFCTIKELNHKESLQHLKRFSESFNQLKLLFIVDIHKNKFLLRNWVQNCVCFNGFFVVYFSILPKDYPFLVNECIKLNENGQWELEGSLNK